MMPLDCKVGLGALDLLSGKKLQGAIMGYNRFPVDLPRLVDFYMRGLLDLDRSEEHTSELQSLMRISYAVFCLKKKKNKDIQPNQKKMSTNMTSSRHHHDYQR